MAADTYGGTIIARNISAVAHNTTRFLVLSSKENLSGEIGDNITALIFQVKHVPGALLSALSAFQECEVNLTKLDTYMVSDEITYPTFYVDVGAGLRNDRMKKALERLMDRVIYMKLLGTFRASDLRSNQSGFLPVQ